MKKACSEFMLFVLMLTLASCCLAQDVNLQCVQIENGWISGTVSTVLEDRICEIKVDCAVPQEPYSDEVIITGDRYFSKKDMQRALKAAGQNTQGQFQNSRTYTRYTGDWNAEAAAAAISREEAAEQAGRVGLAYFKALGVDVDPQPVSIDRPYDYEAQLNEHDIYYSHIYADQEDADAAVERFSAQWKKTSLYHPAQAAYTKIEFAVIVDGMRFYPSPEWPAGYEDEPDAWMLGDVSAYVIVSDRGILVEAGTSHIPEIKKRRALKEGELENYAHLLHTRGMQNLVCAPTWQDALTIAVTISKNHAAIISFGEEAGAQTIYRNGKPIQVKTNAKQSVITAIEPCMNTIAENTWVMSWKFRSTNEYADGWRE